ncbi:MAG TPA: zinc ribbon domain-containing protein [Burkholderiales bacterium]|nr:zinc ribbon domain-containing protein [Burkholderiales bacterium]
MATRGIFQKTCPSCTAQLSVDEERCNCGYSFRAEQSLSEEEQAQQQLQFEYVKARLAQAMSTLESLHGTLLADPKNFDKANQLMKAYADVRVLRTELKELSVPTDATDLIGAAAKALEESAQMSSQAPQAFHAVQTQKAEKIMQAAGMKTKECGKCHAILPERAVLCFCGYTFSDVDTASTTVERSAEQHQGM